MTDLRQRIIDASARLVAENGVRAMSFREVARIAEVSHQAPYHYFENHLGIMRAIAQEGFVILTKEMTEAGAKYPGEPLEAMSAAGLAYVHFAMKYLGHFRVMFQRSLVDIHDSKFPLTEGEETFGVLLKLASAVHLEGYGLGMNRDRIALLCWSVVHGIATLLTEGVIATKQGRISIPPSDIADLVVSGLGLLLKQNESNRRRQVKTKRKPSNKRSQQS